MRNKKLLLLIISGAVLAVILFAFGASRLNKSQPEETEIILYYGDICPHCAEVEEYIIENNVKEKVNLQEKEVYHNKENLNELIKKAEICQIPAGSLTVPFLWDGKTCHADPAEIINFFNQKTSQL